MNRLSCTNCQTTWPSLPYNELEDQHNCPLCGDELVPVELGDIEVRDTREQPAVARI